MQKNAFKKIISFTNLKSYQNKRNQQNQLLSLKLQRSNIFIANLISVIKIQLQRSDILFLLTILNISPRWGSFFGVLLFSITISSLWDLRLVPFDKTIKIIITFFDIVRSKFAVPKIKLENKYIVGILYHNY